MKGSPVSFAVTETAFLRARSVFQLLGRMHSGHAEAGMHLAVPFGPDHDMLAPIDAVEGPEEDGSVVLTVRYASELEEVIWRRLDLRGKVLEIRASS